MLVLSWVSVGLQVAMTTCSNPKLQVAHELEYRVVRSAGAADGEIELRAPEEKLVELSSRTPRLRSSTVVTQLTCHENSDIARVQSYFFSVAGLVSASSHDAEALAGTSACGNC